MAKKVVGQLKLQIKAGQANPSPPVGPALGRIHGGQRGHQRLILLVGLGAIARFLYFYFSGEGDGHVQSVVLGGTLVLLGAITLLMGLLADLVGHNRRLIELTLEKVRRLELRK